MTDTVLLWALVAALLVVLLAVATAMRLRIRRDGPMPVNGPENGPGNRAESGPQPMPGAAGQARQAAIPEQRVAAPPPISETAEAPDEPRPVAEERRDEASADPATTALDPPAPARGVGALAADVLVDSLRREGPFRGSVLPSGDGATASDPTYRVKASAATRRCYDPESPFYARTRAELWFRTVADAERAGFTSG